MQRAFKLFHIGLTLTETCCGMGVYYAAQSRIKPLFLEGGQFWDSENKQVAVLGQVASAEQLHCLPSLMGRAEVVVMNAIDWQVRLY